MGEFNVNKSDGSLEQTAGMPSEYPASQVMMPDGVTSVVEKIGNVRMAKLWENPSPSASFAAQNITLNSADYDILIILYNWTKSTASSFSTLVQKNHNFELAATLPSTGGMRTASRPGSYNSTTEVHFSDCLSSVATSGSTDNDRCIPIIIYGIKLT